MLLFGLAPLICDSTKVSPALILDQLLDPGQIRRISIEITNDEDSSIGPQADIISDDLDDGTHSIGFER